jgi:hemolysin activation/secretion protein
VYLRFLFYASLLAWNMNLKADWSDVIGPMVPSVSDRSAGIPLDRPNSSKLSGINGSVGPLFVPRLPEGLRERLTYTGNNERTETDFRHHLGFSGRRVTRLDDFLKLSYHSSEGDDADASARRFRIDYSVPWSRGRLSFYGIHRRYEKLTNGDAGRNKVSGAAQTFNLRINRKLFGNARTRLDGAVVMHTRDRHRSVDLGADQSLKNRSTDVRVEASLRQRFALDITATTGIRMQEGVEVARRRNERSVSQRRDPYRKYVLDASLARPFGHWQCNLKGRYQFAPRSLPRSHYLLAAGSGMIHGLGGQSLKGDEAGWLRADARGPWHLLNFIPGLRASMRASLLAGWVPKGRADQRQYGKTTAAELGVRLQSGDLDAGFSVGRMLSSSVTGMSRPDMPELSFSLSLNL